MENDNVDIGSHLSFDARSFNQSVHSSIHSFIHLSIYFNPVSKYVVFSWVTILWATLFQYLYNYLGCLGARLSFTNRPTTFINDEQTTNYLKNFFDFSLTFLNSHFLFPERLSSYINLFFCTQTSTTSENVPLVSQSHRYTTAAEC